MKAQKNTLACIFAFLTASAPLCGTNIVVDSFFTEQAEQSFSSTDEDSGPLGAVFDPGILGGGRSFGRRQFDQVDFGDSTTVSILNGSLNIEIIDTNPSADENNIFVAYGDINELSTPLNLDLNPFKKFGVFRFEFSAIPVGALLDIQLGAKFSVQNYVLNNLVEEVPISSLQFFGIPNLDNDLSGIDDITVSLRTDDSGYTSISLDSFSIVPEPASALYYGFLCVVAVFVSNFRRRLHSRSE